MERLTRGKLAKKSGVNTATVRYYEKRELLPEPPRSNAGYRMFSTESINRMRFIKQAQEIGFSLKEIKELLDLRVTPRATTVDVRNGENRRYWRKNSTLESYEKITGDSGEQLLRGCFRK